MSHNDLPAISVSETKSKVDNLGLVGKIHIQ